MTNLSFDRTLHLFVIPNERSEDDYTDVVGRALQEAKAEGSPWAVNSVWRYLPEVDMINSIIVDYTGILMMLEMTRLPRVARMLTK